MGAALLERQSAALGRLDTACSRRLGGRLQRPLARASFVVGDTDADAHVVVSLEVGGERAAAFAYDHHGFVMPFSSSIDDLEITVDEGPAEARVWGSVGAAMPSGDRQTLVLWRVYSGGNSWTRDVVSSARDGVHRLAIRGAVVGAPARLACR